MRVRLNKACSQLLSGPTDAEIFSEIEALASRYPQARPLDGEIGKRWWRDWLEDLGDVPADLLLEACRRWRNSTEKWMPSPGQLKSTIESELRTRHAQVRRAKEWLAIAEAKDETL